MSTRCPQCQSDNPESSKFCAECGSRLFPPGGEVFTKTMTLETAYKVLSKGKIFADKYAIIGEIGQGGMGVVYKAEDTRLKRTVALKFLPPELNVHPEAKERFIREAQAAAALSHPNICTIHEVEEADGQPYIAMEYVSGESLRQKAAQGPMAADGVVDIAVQVASGLEAAHQRGIIHRDIKSANIMVTDKGQAKIMDFGLAKVAGESQLTKEARTIGTIAYMSPEQAQGEDLDRRTDIWSFGVILYEMLTGQMPFRGDRESIILHSIVGAEPKPLRQVQPDIPAELQKIIDRALKKKREDRYGSAAEMAVDLGKYLASRRAEEAGFLNLKSLARRMKRPAYFLPAAAIAVALGALAYWRIDHNAHVRWARQEAIPKIESLYQADGYTAAYTLTKIAAKYIPKDPKIAEYLETLAQSFSVTTNPPGARVFLKDYTAPDTSYELIGLTPFGGVEVPRGYKRWKIVKEGFETVEGSGWVLPPYQRFSQKSLDIKVNLDPKGSVPADMVHIQAERDFAPTLGGIMTMPALKLGNYFLDKYEVTNRQYKKFMDDGGYRRPDFWKQKFRRNGTEIPWGEAVKSFVDKTGRPGPATWEFGACPDGQEDYPVSGVSWYEAVAYAEYAGKRLPTVYHWSRAAGSRTWDMGYTISQSNFGGKGPERVGKMQGITPAGVYDMAGNVKEWCWNETADGKRINLGGGWNEVNYMFADVDAYSPWFRNPDFGFRCLKYLTQSPVDLEAARPITLNRTLASGDFKPCSDEIFRVYLRPFEYAKSPLNPRVEDKQEFSRYAVLERVSFDPAYPGERMGAYLFVPREGKGPFQTVVHWPGSGALLVNSISEYSSKDIFDHLTKSGRAVVFPVLRGTFDRKWTQDIEARTTPQERDAMQVKDFMRTIDYLETRPEFDTKKLAFEGLSWGAWLSPVIPAIERRIKAVISIAGGLDLSMPPEYSHINFAPRITAPLLMQNGKYDPSFLIEGNLMNLLRLFGTPDQDKAIKVYEAGHSVWTLMEQKRDEIDFLDKYFGPAR